MILKILHSTSSTGFNYYKYFDGFYDENNNPVHSGYFVKNIKTGNIAWEVIDNAWAQVQAIDIKAPTLGDEEDNDIIVQKEEE